jgi:uncharacterized SAM-binding protein YcdF (DUF218 family)
MNELVGQLGLGGWKAIAAALVLPPTPWLALALGGAALLWKRRALGWVLTGAAMLGLWLCSCEGFAQRLTTLLLRPPPGLTATRLKAIEHDARAGKPVAIVALGGGRERLAPEYGTNNLPPESLERLRYAVWLGRATGVPIAYSGGAGFGREDETSEAQVAARIAASEFGRPLRWTEDDSRDTRENAERTVALLEKAGIREIVLVTHGWHMRRALRNFDEASHGRMHLVPAPVGLAPRIDRPGLLWLPTAPGFTHVHHVLHEALGLLAGS